MGFYGKNETLLNALKSFSPGTFRYIDHELIQFNLSIKILFNYFFFLPPVLSSILENGRDPEPGVHVQDKTPLPQNFFVVNM